MKTTRRCFAVGLLWLGFAAWAATPAAAQAAQADSRYTGSAIAVPTINAVGGVLAASGQASAGNPAGGVLATSGQRESVPTQVLASQVSGGVAGTTQAPVQGLAFTGADVVTMVTVGLVAIMLGIVLNHRSPRSSPQN